MASFHSHAFNTHTKSLSQALLKAEEVNCINVDWINGSLEYIPAVNNLRVAGAEVAYFIDVLMVRRVILVKVSLMAFASPRICGTFPFFSFTRTSPERVRRQALLCGARTGATPWESARGYAKRHVVAVFLHRLLTKGFLTFPSLKVTTQICL